MIFLSRRTDHLDQNSSISVLGFFITFTHDCTSDLGTDQKPNRKSFFLNAYPQKTFQNAFPSSTRALPHHKSPYLPTYKCCHVMLRVGGLGLSPSVGFFRLQAAGLCWRANLLFLMVFFFCLARGWRSPECIGSLPRKCRIQFGTGRWHSSPFLVVGVVVCCLGSKDTGWPRVCGYRYLNLNVWGRGRFFLVVW